MRTDLDFDVVSGTDAPRPPKIKPSAPPSPEPRQIHPANETTVLPRSDIGVHDRQKTVPDVASVPPRDAIGKTPA